MADVDGSLSRDYFIPNGPEAFAVNPRHYLIDRNGDLAYVSATVAPGSLEAAIDAALSEPAPAP